MTIRSGRNADASNGTEREASEPAAEPGVERWSWLAGTYWYVPDAYLPAIRQRNGRKDSTEAVQDQTVWWFERFEGGYLIGRAAASINGGAFRDQTLLGSVTPDGDVLLSFAKAEGDGSDPVIVGQGRMVRYQGAWAFLMQMVNGTNATVFTHWAYMVQGTPDDEAWTSLPGVPGTGIGDVFS